MPNAKFGSIKQHSDNIITVQLPRITWETIVDAIEYAVEDRRYQANCTDDPDDKATIDACAEEWERVKDTLATLLT